MTPHTFHQNFSISGQRIYCTRATADLLEVMLNDAAGLYERDLERENLRRARRGAPDLPPAYTRDDVERVFKQCSPQRSDNIRLVHWAMALLWSILAGTRTTQFWNKLDHTLSLMDNSFYPFLWKISIT